MKMIKIFGNVSQLSECTMIEINKKGSGGKDLSWVDFFKN